MRLFLIGDSFTENLFDSEYQTPSNDAVHIYIEHLKTKQKSKALWFTDWLKLWGYEIYNFGIRGCSIEQMYYQFAKIDGEFREGDRIIVGWTTPSRHNIYNENGEIQSIVAEPTFIENISVQEFLIQQRINREFSMDNNGYIIKNVLPFMEYLINNHSKYKPIVWSPFENISKLICKFKYYFYSPMDIELNKLLPTNKLRIIDDLPESNDRHYNIYGNYYLAIIMKHLLQNTKSEYYINDSNIITNIINEINTTPDIQLNNVFLHYP
jgi:hypothetical protein